MAVATVILATLTAAFYAALYFPIGWQCSTTPAGIKVLTVYVTHPASRRMFYVSCSVGCRRADRS